MYRMDSVPASDTPRRLPMDVLVVLRWARTTLLEDWETADGMAFHSESDHAHWKALVELCEER